MSKRLLIVDDDAGIQRLFKRFFERLGYQVAVAGDGTAALDLLRKQGAALMFLDVHMPSLDGLAVLRSAQEAHPGLPVVVVSGMMDQEKARLFLQEGARDYITKPVELGSLERIVSALLA